MEQLSSLQNNGRSTGQGSRGRGGGQQMQQQEMLPVMFYIHGGGLAGNIFPISGQYLLDEDVILVTSHYRLGILG